mmetsp:Transcript_39052/g.72727  ORF Transcript_39052/g.72727 Transcript_39052/m.72727 type:complete len:245 (-) Transcript_39052:835-1569(-)
MWSLDWLATENHVRVLEGTHLCLHLARFLLEGLFPARLLQVSEICLSRPHLRAVHILHGFAPPLPLDVEVPGKLQVSLLRIQRGKQFMATARHRFRRFSGLLPPAIIGFCLLFQGLLNRREGCHSRTHGVARCMAPPLVSKACEAVQCLVEGLGSNGTVFCHRFQRLRCVGRVLQDVAQNHVAFPASFLNVRELVCQLRLYARMCQGIRTKHHRRCSSGLEGALLAESFLFAPPLFFASLLTLF